MSRPRLDPHRPAQQGDPLLHSVQAKSGGFIHDGRCVKPDAVVPDDELEHSLIVLQHDTNHACLGVPRHVGKRLLQDPIHGGLHEWGQPANAAYNAKVNDNSHRFGKLAHVSPSGRHEPFVIQDGGMQAAGQPPDVVHGLCRHFA